MSDLLPCPFNAIVCRDGEIALIDPCDRDAVRAHNWTFSNRYVCTSIHGKTVRLHRFIVQPGPGMHVDHINGDSLDNRRANLRVCTRSQNLQNRRLNADSRTGIKGVGVLSTGRYRVRVQANGKRLHIGVFDTLEEAALARSTVAMEMHKEFYREK